MVRRRRYGFTKPYLIAFFWLVDTLGSILAALARVRRSRPFSAGVRRILLVNFAHIGDVLMIAPALKAVRASHPDAYIAALVGPWSKDLLLANPYLDEVLVYRPSWWDRQHGGYLRPGEFRALVRLLRAGRFDLSLNFKSFFQENLALWLAGIPLRLGYGIYGGGFFLSKEVLHKWGLHTVEQNLALVGAVPKAGGFSSASTDGATDKRMLRQRGIRLSVAHPLTPSPSPNTPEMFVFEEDMVAADAFLASALGDVVSPSALVAFHIGAGYPSKLWGAERYAELADAMATRWQARILIVGGQDDLPLIARMEQQTRERVIVAAGKLNIRQTAALIARCQLFVGNDSGPAHIAAAVGIPTLALFSGENEASLWRPYAENCQIIQRHPDCAPCGKRHCDRDHRCMVEITVDEVMSAAERILQWFGPL